LLAIVPYGGAGSAASGSGGAAASLANKSPAGCVASGLLERRIFCLSCFFSGGREDVCCFHGVGGASVPLGYGDGRLSFYLLVFCERVGAWGIPIGGWLVWVSLVSRRRQALLPVVGPQAGDCGFLLPLLFSPGDGRWSFNRNDALGGVPGVGSCGFTNIWSPLL